MKETNPRTTRLNKTLQWIAMNPYWTLSLAVVVALVPFLGKPFNMDDPLFIWAARHIESHPTNPYGFDVNWYGTVNPMWEVTKNPPLACYYLSTAGGILGWSELALHTAFLLPALAVILGTYRLARHFCNQPMLPALLTLLTPVFLVSSTTVMCDVLMLAFWVWAVVMWVEGIRQDNLLRLSAAGILIALATLTKYFAVALIPLLAAYGFIHCRRWGRWIIGLIIPLAALYGYHLATQNLYGRTLLSDAANYTAFPNSISEFISAKFGSGLTALTFTGGCLAMAALFAPLLWGGKQLALIVGGTTLISIALFSIGAVLKDYGPIVGSSRLFIEFQIILWATVGVSVLALAITDLRHQRNANAWLLSLWVGGTFMFLAFFNWTVNGRTVLPMTPAVAILLARRLERFTIAKQELWSRSVSLCLAGNAAISFMVARADFMFASAVRESARLTNSKHAQGSERFFYQGHWGFQYYMNALGSSALDSQKTLLQRGDIIATPQNNVNSSPLGPELVVLREMITVKGPAGLTTMAGEVGAGFYAALRGPLPFAFGIIPAERVAVCVVDPITSPTQSSPLAK